MVGGGNDKNLDGLPQPVTTGLYWFSRRSGVVLSLFTSMEIKQPNHQIEAANTASLLEAPAVGYCEFLTRLSRTDVVFMRTGRVGGAGGGIEQTSNPSSH